MIAKKNVVGTKLKSLVRSMSEGVEDVSSTISRRMASLDRLNVFESELDIEEDKSRIANLVCDLFIEVFELKERRNWLRKRAVQLILQ